MPWIASGAGESVNKMLKNPKEGDRRIKSTMVQLVRKLINIGHRSSLVLTSAPVAAAKKRKKELNELQRRRPNLCAGRYAILKFALQVLTWDAYTRIKNNLSMGEKHTASVGDMQVLANFKPLATDTRYVHNIVEQDGRWVCLVDGGEEECWQHALTGVFCPHMCSLAQKIMSAGGEFDVRIIARSCNSRYHRSSHVMETVEVPHLSQPRPTANMLKNVVDTNKAVTEQRIAVSVSALNRLCGEEALRNLHHLIQWKLLGGGDGGKAVDLLQKFLMSTRHSTSTLEDVPRKSSTRYRNNQVSVSRRATKRINNRGDMSGLSPAKRVRKKETYRKKYTGDITLTGINHLVGTNYFNLRKAQNKKLLDAGHKIIYVTPLKYYSDKDQLHLLQQYRFHECKVIGLDIEYSGPIYPKKRGKSFVYDVSLLTLTNNTATLCWHLFQYQQVGSACLQWPGPYLAKFETTKGWKAYDAGKGKHGDKWTMPSVLAEHVLNRTTTVLTGRNIKADMTRLARVFLPPGKKFKAKSVDVVKLKEFLTRAPTSNSLSDLMKCFMGCELADKTRERVRRAGWNTWQALQADKLVYAASDCMASYILGRAYLFKKYALTKNNPSSAVTTNTTPSAKTSSTPPVKNNPSTTPSAKTISTPHVKKKPSSKSASAVTINTTPSAKTSSNPPVKNHPADETTADKAAATKKVSVKKSRRVQSRRRRMTYSKGAPVSHSQHNRCPVCNAVLAPNLTVKVRCTMCRWFLVREHDGWHPLEEEDDKREEERPEKKNMKVPFTSRLPWNGEPVVAHIRKVSVGV